LTANCEKAINETIKTQDDQKLKDALQNLKAKAQKFIVTEILGKSEEQIYSKLISSLPGSKWSLE